jgi:hypothetical protein
MFTLFRRVLILFQASRCASRFGLYVMFRAVSPVCDPISSFLLFLSFGLQGVFYQNDGATFATISAYYHYDSAATMSVMPVNMTQSRIEILRHCAGRKIAGASLNRFITAMTWFDRFAIISIRPMILYCRISTRNLLKDYQRSDGGICSTDAQRSAPRIRGLHPVENPKDVRRRWNRPDYSKSKLGPMIISNKGKFMASNFG